MNSCNFCHCRFIECEHVLVFDYCDDASVWESKYCSTKCFVNDMLKNEYLVISEFTNLDKEVIENEV